jgi:hypothetical protein
MILGDGDRQREKGETQRRGHDLPALSQARIILTITLPGNTVIILTNTLLGKIIPTNQLSPRHE